MGKATETLTIRSHKGPYSVEFFESLDATLRELPPLDKCRYIVDEQVWCLYRAQLTPLIDEKFVYVLEASEANKSLERMAGHVSRLLEIGARRDHQLVAIGGGIIQDISCYIASTLFRGMRWSLMPTTLLAQTDSCIGSKSSINVNEWKNIVGTFTPPNRVLICAQFLETLTHFEMRSGIGEMLKVHMIDGTESYFAISRDVESLLKDRRLLQDYTRRSLLIKQKLIELDEFDQGPRNILNYGHSFGHAIESATDFMVPHGVAVTMGMDMANYTSARLGRWSETQYREARPALKANAERFYRQVVPLDRFMSAISKDKKNIGAQLVLILPDSAGRLEKVRVDADSKFRDIVSNYFLNVRME